MKTKQLKIIALFFAIGLTIFSACEKPEPDSQSAEDDARGSYIMADAFAVSNSEAGNNGGGKIAYPEGMTVETLSTGDSTGTTTITFENCNYRGSVRNGEIIIAYTVQDFDLNATAYNLVITFDDYTVDGAKVEGSIATTFDVNSDNIPEINVVATGMKVTEDGKEFSWSAAQTYTFKEGFGTLTQDDDVIEMSGTVTGNNKAGKDFTSVYASVLKKSCSKYPVSGTSTITSDDKITIIDYGNGECDNKISVTSNGVTVNITLD